MVLPLKAREIELRYQSPNGGLGVTAHTDRIGEPYIGLYRLSRDGNRLGAPVHIHIKHLLTRMPIAYNDGKPIMVFVDAEVTHRGLELRIVPLLDRQAAKHRRYMSAKWEVEEFLYREEIAR